MSITTDDFSGYFDFANDAVARISQFNQLALETVSNAASAQMEEARTLVDLGTRSLKAFETDGPEEFFAEQVAVGQEFWATAGKQAQRFFDIAAQTQNQVGTAVQAAVAEAGKLLDLDAD